MHQALEAWLSLVASAAGLGAVRLSFVLAKHFGMQFTVSEQAWIRGHAQSCALLVEEWAAQQIAAGVTPTSKTKLEAACYKLCERTGISRMKRKRRFTLRFLHSRSEPPKLHKPLKRKLRPQNELGI